MPGDGRTATLRGTSPTTCNSWPTRWETGYPTGFCSTNQIAFVDLGYLEGTHAPGRKSILDFLRATHVVNVAQGDGFRALKSVRPSARVGSALSMSPCEPATNSAEDQLAAERAHAISNIWFLDPALRGRYPDALTFFPKR